MANLRRFIVACSVFGILAPFTCVAQTIGQTPPDGRFDVAGSIGWFSAHERLPVTYSSWYHRFSGNATLGYYWTEHLKTELAIGRTSKGELYSKQPEINLNGLLAYGSIEHTFSTDHLAVGQLYQFGHNAWFHPNLTAGCEVQRIRQIQHWSAVYPPRGSSPVVPSRTVGPITDVRVFPYAGGGFKAYMTEQAFFRSDIRVSFDHGVKDVDAALGWGFDF